MTSSTRPRRSPAPPTGQISAVEGRAKIPSRTHLRCSVHDAVVDDDSDDDNEADGGGDDNKVVVLVVLALKEEKEVQELLVSWDFG